MSDKKKQRTGQFGIGNKSETTINEATPENQIVIPKEIYRENLENAVKRKELELQVAHNDEKIKLYEQIDDLKNSLANLPESLKKAEEANAELVARLEQMGGKDAEKKFEKAIDAFQENKLAKADKILIEIEETERLDKKNFGGVAYARGHIAQQDMRWKDAVEHYTRAVQLNPCFETLINAQKLSYSIGDYNYALSLAHKTTKAAIKEHGEDTEEYALSISSLGLIHMAQKKYELAEPLHTEALKIRENIFGKKHTEVAMSLTNLGGIYQEQKQHKKATYFLNRALNIQKKSLGEKHYVTATILNNLGGSYSALGEFRKAKPFIKRAVNIRKEIFGDNHPDIASSYNNLGSLYFMQGQYKKADPYYCQGLEIFEMTLGPDHPKTILIKKNYENNKKHLAKTQKPPPNNTGGLIVNP